MSLFPFHKKVNNTVEPDFVIQKQEKQQNTVPASMLGQSLVKAILILFLVFGSLGGLLAAYQVEYNLLFVALAVFVLSVIFSFVYATEKRWLINLLLLGSLAAYFSFAIRSYWYINSGYYGVLNRILEEARTYLAVYNGTEYALLIEDEYQAVTYFVLFIGIIAVLLFSIHFSRKANLLLVVLLTFPFYLIPMYFERPLGMGYVLMLVAGYALTVLLHALLNGEKRRYQWRYLLVVIGLFLLCARLFTLVLSPNVYRANVSQSAAKRQSEKQMSELVQSGFMASFGGGSAGMSGGRLGNGGSVRPDYETDLIVEYTPYSYAPVYLKGFLGAEYDGQRWIPPAEVGIDVDFWTKETLEGLQKQEDDWAQGKMIVTNVGADEDYSYYPYYTDTSLSETLEEGEKYTFYPYRRSVSATTSGVAKDYLMVPERCLNAVEEICRDAGFSGSEEEIAAQVTDYFAENYAYTLSPGYRWGGGDYISTFLLNSKRGYCMHFASAGVMLFRYMGIPARYAEGYVFSYNDMMVDGELVDDADFADYFSGYSELGETGVIRLEIPDANAHAWVEIYVEGKGWVPVDVTPAAVSEETESFWDAFQQRNRELSSETILQGNAAEYLGRIVNGTGWILLAALLLLAVVVIFRRFLHLRRERALEPRERVQQTYRRLIEKASERQTELGMAQPIRKQLIALDRIADRKHKRKDRQVSQKDESVKWRSLEESLYRTFYGEEMPDSEYEELYRILKQLERKDHIR